CQQESTWTTF
nr:immunoglobulin light chain junction region [Macaca mulatta]MPO01157.1 immunoglobulin light chain junction region [Macaca mulatta]